MSVASRGTCSGAGWAAGSATVNLDGRMVRRYAERAAILDALARRDSGATERFYRDVRGYRILGGTNDIRRLIIAGKLLRKQGLKASVGE